MNRNRTQFLTSFFTITLATTGLARTALAQTAPDWNRELQAISITPAGDAGHRVTAYVKHGGTGIATTVDLSTEVLFHLNGTAVASESFSVMLNPAGDGGGGPCGMPCTLGETCVCHDVPPEYDCGFWIATPEIELELRPEDEIMVILRPAPGAAPESSTTDDVLMKTFHGEDLFWNRRIASVSQRPTSTGGRELYVELEIEGNYSGGLDLGGQLLISAGGTPLGPFPTSFDDLGGWTECSEVACNDTVACVIDASGPFYGSCQPEGDSCLCKIHYVPMVIPLPFAPAPGPLVVQLVPVPGALPELPGFPDDDAITCTGDVDGDGFVTFSDLLAVLAAWGPCNLCPEDTDGSGEVDFGDVLIVLSAWGACFPV